MGPIPDQDIPQPCKVPGTSPGRCAYAGPDGLDICPGECRWKGDLGTKAIAGSPGSSIIAAMRDRTVAWRLPHDLHARLERAATERGVKTTWLVTKLLEEGLDRALPPSEFRLTRPRQTAHHPDCRPPMHHPNCPDRDLWAEAMRAVADDGRKNNAGPLTVPLTSAGVPPDQTAAALLTNVRDRGDDYGDLANATADDLRDALRLAAELLGPEPT